MTSDEEREALYAEHRALVGKMFSVDPPGLSEADAELLVLVRAQLDRIELADLGWDYEEGQ